MLERLSRVSMQPMYSAIQTFFFCSRRSIKMLDTHYVELSAAPIRGNRNVDANIKPTVTMEIKADPPRADFDFRFSSPHTHFNHPFVWWGNNCAEIICVSFGVHVVVWLIYGDLSCLFNTFQLFGLRQANCRMQTAEVGIALKCTFN